MFGFPILLPVAWVLGLVALAAVGFGAFVVVGFFLGVVTAATALITGVGLLVLSALGRFLVLLFKRSGEDEPHEYRVGDVQRLRRPDGTELQVETHGRDDGQALILTHGWGSDSTQWYYLKKHLSARFRVIVWDIRGLGRSTPSPADDYSLDRLAEDLEAVVGLAGERAVLVGHSMGGMVILRLCRRARSLPSNLAGVVLANTTPMNPVQTTAGGRLVAALERPVIVPLLHLTTWIFPLVWLMNWLSYMNGTMHLMLALTGFAGTESRGQLDRVAVMGARQHPGVLARQGLAMLDHNEIETLFAMPVPVLLLTADRDRVTVPQATEEMRRKTPSAELVTLAPSGHVSVFERHDAFAEAVERFAGTAVAQS